MDGIGDERTLVLINGRRVVAGDNGANASVDLNTIPTSVVKRAEVLKDGASATYGSDAITGVENIITRNDYGGFELKLNAGQSGEGDAEAKGVDLTFGAASDRGYVVVSLGYNDQGDPFRETEVFQSMNFVPMLMVALSEAIHLRHLGVIWMVTMVAM